MDIKKNVLERGTDSPPESDLNPACLYCGTGHYIKGVLCHYWDCPTCLYPGAITSTFIRNGKHWIRAEWKRRES